MAEMETHPIEDADHSLSNILRTLTHALFASLIGIIAVIIAVVIGGILLWKVARADIERIDDQLQRIESRIEQNKCNCGPGSVEASGNTVNVTGMNSTGELAREILQKKGLVNGDVSRVVRSERCGECPCGCLRCGSECSSGVVAGTSGDG